MNHIEDNEQICLMEWATAQSGKFPELSLMFHIPNGGKRNAREAARFKRMGVKAGVPDMFFPVPRGGCHGLFIELKAPRGRLSDYQRGWIERLKTSGYAVAVCYRSDEARRDILRYLKLETSNRR